MAFPEYRHHIIFVSAQNAPAYLPAVLHGSKLPCLHAIVSDAMLDKSAMLANAWKKRNGKYCQYRLQQIEQEQIFEVLDKILAECGEDDLALNITGGNKLMALAAHDWAYACEIPIFYVDTAQDRIVCPGKRCWQYEALPDILDIDAILPLYGYEIEKRNADSLNREQREAVTGLLDIVCARGGLRAMAALNSRAVSARDARCCRYESSPALDKLLAICQKAGKLSLTDGVIHFADEDARKWCNGAWLEDYIRMTLYQLAHEGKIKSWASSAQVRKFGVLNELDAIFSARNRLYAIECNTSRMDGAPGETDAGKAASTLYKIDSLQDRLGGILASAMVCSINQLPERDRERASSMRVQTVCGADLKNIKERIIRWISK